MQSLHWRFVRTISTTAGARCALALDNEEMEDEVRCMVDTAAGFQPGGYGVRYRVDGAGVAHILSGTALVYDA
jgi:hypothetical protein